MYDCFATSVKQNVQLNFVYRPCYQPRWLGDFCFLEQEDEIITFCASSRNRCKPDAVPLRLSCLVRFFMET